MNVPRADDLRRPIEAAVVNSPASWRSWVWRGVLIAVGGLVLYGILPQMLDLWAQVPRLRSIGWFALAFVAGLQFMSWWCSAELDRVALPGRSRVVAVTSSLGANGISRVVPAAGGALGVGLSYQMWTDSGVDIGPAASAMAATTVMSLATLFALPVVTLVFALIGAPTPHSLVLVAVGGAVAFAVLFGLGAALLLNDWFLQRSARLAESISRRLHHSVTAADIEEERNRLRAVLGARWRATLAYRIVSYWLSLPAALVAWWAFPRRYGRITTVGP